MRKRITVLRINDKKKRKKKELRHKTRIDIRFNFLKTKVGWDTRGRKRIARE